MVKTMALHKMRQDSESLPRDTSPPPNYEDIADTEPAIFADTPGPDLEAGMAPADAATTHPLRAFLGAFLQRLRPGSLYGIKLDIDPRDSLFLKIVNLLIALPKLIVLLVVFVVAAILCLVLYALEVIFIGDLQLSADNPQPIRPTAHPLRAFLQVFLQRLGPGSLHGIKLDIDPRDSLFLIIVNLLIALPKFIVLLVVFVVATVLCLVLYALDVIFIGGLQLSADNLQPAIGTT